MNNSIAKIHKLQRKTLGLIVASGSILALCLSFLLIVAGIEITALLYPPTSDKFGLLLYAIIWGIAALMIGVLIERLTTTNCAKLRIMRDKIDLIEENFTAIEEPTEDTKLECEKDKIAAQKGRSSIILLIALGTGLSMMCESFIIHFLFVSWHPIVIGPILINIGWIASLFLSGLVSYTLISSELHKRLDADVLHESLNADTFLATAARANIKDRVNEQILIQSSTKVDEITQSGVMTSAIDRAVIKQVDDVMQGNGEIVLRIDDEREAKRLQLLQDKERTRQQLSVIRGGDTEPLAIADMGFVDDTPQPQKSKNYLKVEQIYHENGGEEYFTSNRRSRIARQLGISSRHIDRILNSIKETRLEA